MSSAAIAGDRVSDTLEAAVDALTRVLPDSLGADEAALVLLGVRRAIDRLEGEFARLAAVVDRSKAWRASGSTSMAAWLSRTSGMAPGRVRNAVELGRAFEAVPALGDAVRSGELSPAAAAKVIPAITDDGFADVATPLIGELAGRTPAAVQRDIEHWKAAANPADDHERRADARHGRTLTFRPLGDGMEHVKGDIPTEVARGLRAALTHLIEQQRLDGSGRSRGQRRVDALGELADAFNRGEVAGGRNVPRIIVTMTLDQLESRSRIGTDASGELVTSAEIDQLCCDAAIHRYVADQDGAVLNFGRGRRTASPQQYLALVARDRGCRHPGCDRPPGWCEAHHLREFAARGGLTNLDELVLLCHHHHHALHDGGWRLRGEPTHLIFAGPAGQTLQSELPRHDTKKVA